MRKKLILCPELVSAFSPLFVCGKHFTNIHLKMAKMIASDDAPYIK